MYENILKAEPKADLSVFIIWSQILPTDNRESAEKLAEEFKDHRAQFFWDADKMVGHALKPKLDIGDTPFAWDVYCFFGAQSEWGEQLPDVLKWAHQLGGANKSHYYGDQLGSVLQSWARELTGGAASSVKAEQFPENIITIRAEDIRPIPEVLLDKILDDLSKQLDSEIDPITFEKIATQLRSRMRKATQPFAGKVPKAVRYGEHVLIPSTSGCAQSD